MGEKIRLRPRPDPEHRALSSLLLCARSSNQRLETGRQGHLKKGLEGDASSDPLLETGNR
jgi:hypothetical protein